MAQSATPQAAIPDAAQTPALAITDETIVTSHIGSPPFDRDQLSQPAFSLESAFMSYHRGDGHWRLTAFVKNIADKTVKLVGRVATSFLEHPVVGFVQSPRTYGATLGYCL